MQDGIHPEYKDIKVQCSCGNKFVTGSTLKEESYSIEVCSECHPFYTGKMKVIDNAGRVSAFYEKFGKSQPAQDSTK